MPVVRPEGRFDYVCDCVCDTTFSLSSGPQTPQTVSRPRPVGAPVPLHSPPSCGTSPNWPRGHGLSDFSRGSFFFSLNIISIGGDSTTKLTGGEGQHGELTGVEDSTTNSRTDYTPGQTDKTRQTELLDKLNSRTDQTPEQKSRTYHLVAIFFLSPSHSSLQVHHAQGHARTPVPDRLNSRTDSTPDKLPDALLLPYFHSFSCTK